MSESVQKWLERNRPPRVRITYDVHTDGAIERRELPFIIGVLADLSGDRLPVDDAQPDPPPMKQRSMVPIDRDNFDAVMKTVRPRVTLAKVERKVVGPDGPGGKTLSGDLRFSSLADFEPLNVVLKIPALHRLYHVRGSIRDLQAKAEANEMLAEQLDELVAPDAAALRSDLQVFRRPQVDATDLAAARARLFALAVTLSFGDDDRQKAAAQAWGVPLLDKDGKAAANAAAADAGRTTAPLRRFLLLFDGATAADPGVLDRVFAPQDDATKKAVSDLRAELAKPVEGSAESIDRLAKGLGVLRLLGTLLEPDDEGWNDDHDHDPAKATPRQLTELRHARANRWFATNLLLQLQADPGPDISQEQWAVLHKPLDDAAKAVEADANATGDAKKAARSAADLVKAVVDGQAGKAQTLDETAWQQLSDALARRHADLPATPKPDKDAAKTSADLAKAVVDAKSDATKVAANANAALANAAVKAASEAKEVQDPLLVRLVASASKLPPVLAARRAAAMPQVWKRLESAQGVFDEAAPTDADRQGLLAAVGYFSVEVLARLDTLDIDPLMISAAVAIDKRVEQIDKEIGTQLNEVMHAPNFRAVESTWRGLHYLVSRAETGPMLKLRAFNATREELLDDLERAIDRDQSQLFRMIYEEEFGTLGGTPYSLLVGGYELGRTATDTAFLRKMAEVAAAAHAPFIAAAAPDLFGLKSFRDLARPRELAKIFEGAELAGWQEFRSTEDSRYVSLVLPHVLLRPPYSRTNWPAQGLAYDEDALGDGPGDGFLWGSAAYLLAERIAHAFSLYSWTAAIRGVEGGGLIEGLPLYTFDPGSGTQTLFCPTEVTITDRREKELSDLGFISLCHCKGKGMAAFFGGQTANLPRKYISPEANANARLSALLPYMLAASRFAHYIKSIMRDKVGSFLTRANVESYLNNWIAQYVLLDQNAAQEAKASYPLSQAKVVVTDVPGEPGNYKAVVFLRPHFQLEELSTSIRLVAELPSK